jgi:hypothetical protein
MEKKTKATQKIVPIHMKTLIESNEPCEAFLTDDKTLKTY